MMQTHNDKLHFIYNRVVSVVAAAFLATATCVTLSPTAAMAEIGNLVKAAIEDNVVSNEAVNNTVPTTSLSPSSPETEDAEYAATMAALESLGYSTEHYAERQKKINEYKDLLRANECQEMDWLH
jgi:hypothetical protein